jgi:hypothetical protein
LLLVAVAVILAQVQVGERGRGFGDARWAGVRYHFRLQVGRVGPAGDVGLGVWVQRVIPPAAAGAADLDGRGVAELAEQDTQDGDAG